MFPGENKPNEYTLISSILADTSYNDINVETQTDMSYVTRVKLYNIFKRTNIWIS